MKNLSEPVELDDIFKEIEIRDNKFPHKQLNKLFPNGIGSYNAFYAIAHPWVMIKDGLREIKWAWQRVFRGWDDRVTWSIDTYLAEMIPQWMKRLRETKQGTPGLLFGDNNWNKTKYEFFIGAHETADMKYNAILKIIIDGFEKYDDGDFYDRPKDKEKFDLAFKFFHEYFGTLWD